jgi:nickel-dependent lactate racemase
MRETLISLPYGRGSIACTIPSDKVQAILEPKAIARATPPLEAVLEALDRPIGSERLRDLAKGKGRALLITSDHTRPVPSRMTLPLLLQEIGRGDMEVDLLIATGLHSPPSKGEMEEKYGKENLEKFSSVEVHRSGDDDGQYRAGILSTGLELYLNKALSRDDQLVIAEGFIEPHFFAGFTGGPKSILPGVAGAKSIIKNHSAERIDDSNSRSGILDGNPIQEEMREAALKAGLSFILNVILDEGKSVVRAFAGGAIATHGVGCRTISAHNVVKASPAEIVVTSNNGFPLDRNMYQMVKGLSAAALTVKTGGIIVIAGECVDGVGHDKFYNMLVESDGPAELLGKIRNGEINEEDQWEAQILAKVLEKARVMVVSKGLDRRSAEAMHMLHSTNLEKAIDEAFEMAGPGSRVTVLPKGPATIVA